MKYHVKWLIAGVVGKEVVEDINVGVFIVGLVNDGAVVMQCEPI